MPRTRSTRSIARFARFAVAAGVLASICVAVRGERAYACGGGDWGGIEEVTTFDPKLLGEWDGLAWDPDHAGFGGGCSECLTTAMVSDWIAYLNGVSAPDWQKILIKATEQELAELRTRAGKPSAPAPKGYETSTVWKAQKDRLIAALDFVKLARQLEPYASFDNYDPDGNQRTIGPPPITLENVARSAWKA
jgi:hypothetical protein